MEVKLKRKRKNKTRGFSASNDLPLGLLITANPQHFIRNGSQGLEVSTDTMRIPDEKKKMLNMIHD